VRTHTKKFLPSGDVFYPVESFLISTRPVRLDAEKMIGVLSLNEQFGNAFIESVMETITELLGPRVMEAYFSHMETHLGISKTEIPRRSCEFFSALDQTFGVGGRVIGRLIVKKLYRKLGIQVSEVFEESLPEEIREVKDEWTNRSVTSMAESPSAL
jgi:hypothetical protein